MRARRATLDALCLAAALLVTTAATTRAQTVRGTVRDSTAGTPLPGAVVSLVDSAGVVSGRTIADATGRFALARRPGADRLRVLRIGYQPHEFALPPAQRDAPLELAMVRIPPVLTTVNVSDRELCPGSNDRGAAFQLWEQARAGLLGQVVGNAGGTVKARALTYRRRVSPSDGLVQSQIVETHNGNALRPFVAVATPSAFAQRGYMQEDASGRTFGAPDADVLLHESFAATHCFRLQAADDKHPGQVGLAFVPAPGRDTMVDVSGVIWIDQTMSALRSFDFRYTSLERAAMRADVGGHIDFEAVPNGVSFIERWTLRLPILTPIVTNSTAPRTTRRRQDRADLRVSEIAETGGQVLDAKWTDGTTWVAPPTGLSGVVSETKTDVPLAGVTITIDGTAERTTTDARGEFMLAPLIPGRYAATITDTSFSALTSARKASDVIDVAPGQVVRLFPVLASVARERARAAAHGLTAASVGPRVIRGLVTDTANRPIPNVTLTGPNGWSGITNDSGRFRVELASRGDAVFDARRIGFIPSRYVLREGRDTSVTMTLLPMVQQLAAVEVNAEGNRGLLLRGFEDRMHARERGAGGGQFITAADIERRKPDNVTSIFDNVLGVRVMRVGLTSYALFGKSRTWREGEFCPATVYMDGVRIMEGSDVVDPTVPAALLRGVPINSLVSPTNIAGIEVYSSGNAAPAAYHLLNGSCSVVLIWTKPGR